MASHRMAPSEQDILAALSELIDPVTGRNYVESKSVKNVKFEGERVALDVVLGYPARGVLETVRKQVSERLARVPGVSQASVNVVSKVVSHAVQRGVKLVPGIKNIIAVASGKGGVGKSTTAVNLALALAAEGATVGMLDADIYGPSVPRLTGIREKPQLNDARKMIPIARFGLAIMSIGFLVEEETAMIWRGPMVMSAITQMLRDVAWGTLDILVVDMPPGTGDAQLTLAQNVPLKGAIIISTPQDLSLIDARRGLAMFKKVNVPVLGIVENMSYFQCPHCGTKSDIFGHGGARHEAERLGVPFLGEIPLHMSIRVTSDSGTPVVESEPDGPHAAIYRAIGAKVRDQLQGVIAAA
jgi:ATP-binding protein involved in chromosome partitioning